MQQRCAGAPAINLSLRMMWRPAAVFAKEKVRLFQLRKRSLSPDALNSLLALCIGFSFAGALASGYQACTERPAGFGFFQERGAPHLFSAVPFLVCAAP